MPERQYVFCIPRSGFNDILCQMEKAWSYAESHGRTLVVDARYCALEGAFTRYFSTEAGDVFLHPGEALLRHLDRLEVFPPCLRGRVSRHAQQAVDSHSIGGTRVDSDTGQLLTFDMTRPYQENVLVHHSSGGGDMGLGCLQRLKLVPEVALDIARALAVLGEDYDAVHIRNTDIGTDYLPFFRQIFPLVRGRKLLICSDDLACREAALKFFVESQVLTVTDIPDTGGQALHLFVQNIHAKNLSMLTDLFALARARRLFVSQITHGSKKGKLSGFSRLALALHAHPETVDKLFGSSCFTCGVFQNQARTP